MTVAGAVIACIVPQGKMKKSFRVLLAIVVIYAIASPLAGVDLRRVDFDSLFSENTSLSEELSEKSEKAVLESAKSAYITAAENMLKEKNIPFSSVDVKAVIKDDTVKLLKVTVYTEGEASVGMIKAALSELGSFDTEIVTAGEYDEK